MDNIERRGVEYIRLSSFFPAYQVSRARSWVKNYDPGSLRIFVAPGETEPDEWVEEEAAERCEADINRSDPNIIDLEVVYDRILASNGRETAELFKQSLLEQRESRKARGAS